ncbi:MAG: dephospho-CoA kinase [Desulfuromonas sp.]|nr:MAG: dephospho-CoA kinase [Desulfuromonas sp.]
MVLGITGGIATGKSRVAELFAECGATVISADELAREVVAPGGDVLKALADRFGAGILLPDGYLDRTALAAIIFADPAARSDLNRIIHPAIAELAEVRLQKFRDEGVDLIVYEAPLLFEADAVSRVDKVLVVTADNETQLQRLMARDQIDQAAAQARVAAQMPLAEKVARADYVIDNSGSVEQTAATVRTLYRQLADFSGT